MYSGIINKFSPQVDVLEVLSGVWNEYDKGEFHVVVTPFFTVVSATLDAGSHVLPFSVTVPVAGTVSHADGTVEAVIVKPGDTAISLSQPGIFQLDLFGSKAKVK